MRERCPCSYLGTDAFYAESTLFPTVWVWLAAIENENENLQYFQEQLTNPCASKYVSLDIKMWIYVNPMRSMFLCIHQDKKQHSNLSNHRMGISTHVARSHLCFSPSLYFVSSHCTPAHSSRQPSCPIFSGAQSCPQTPKMIVPHSIPASPSPRPTPSRPSSSILIA